MKKILVKFSDERNKKYCIRTIIAQDETTAQKFVIKENIYPEGEEHLKNIVRFSDVLKTAYPEVKICPVQELENKSIRFDFIEGVSLEEQYRQCLLKNSETEMEKLLIRHKKLVLGAKSNRCDFEMTDGFKEVFGMESWYGDRKALKVANFDAIASNVICQKEVPTFIDYEWVYEFPVPEDLVIYHCIYEAYSHITGLEDFYPLSKAMKFLEVTTELELLKKAYSNFHTYVIRENNGDSYAICKILNLKGIKEGDAKALERIQQLELDIIFFEKNWREACQANTIANQRVAKLEQELSRVGQLEAAVQEQARQTEVYKTAYESVINSRTWRLVGKLKRLLGRK